MLERTVLTVSELNSAARTVLEANLPLLWVEGEISNFRDPGSGHLYFTLKDRNAQVRCALFRMRAERLKFQPQDGMHVVVQALVSLYEGRGDFQLIVEIMEEVGDGALRRAFELLKKRLAEEGLFADAHKKTWPKLPQCIGVVTSPTGAAIRDILSVLKRRFPSIPVIIYPTQVQGLEAAKQIARALYQANQRQECEVILLARGGGSLEDLWPFNEEVVARAIFASHIPVVSGVGHEVDVTIADFVADHRAPTPSAAAELVSPDRAEFEQRLIRLSARLSQALRTQLRHFNVLLQHLEQRLPHPVRRLQQTAQRLDELRQRLLLGCSHVLRHYQSDVNQLARSLDAVSPLNTLNRGYAIVQKGSKILRRAEEVEVGDEVRVRLARGELVCEVRGVMEQS